MAHGTKHRSLVWNALGAAQASTPQMSAKMKVTFHWDWKSVEERRDEVQSLFVSWANSNIRIGDESFGYESTEIRVGFFLKALADL